MRAIGLLAMVVGLALVALSFVWLVLFPPERHWTYEQAKEHAQNVATYHQLAHTVGGHSHGKGPVKRDAASKPTQADLDAVRKRWEQSDAALRTAQTTDRKTAWWLRGAGVIVAALGVAGVALDKKHAVKRVAAPEVGEAAVEEYLRRL